jgi:hypothetical protein
MGVEAGDVLVRFEPFAREGAVSLHAGRDHDDHEVVGAGHVVALLHQGMIDHLPAESVQVRRRRGYRGHAQGDDARHHRGADQCLVEHRGFRGNDSLGAQALQAPLHGGGR